MLMDETAELFLKKMEEQLAGIRKELEKLNETQSRRK